jgi:hypothetical protein
MARLPTAPENSSYMGSLSAIGMPTSLLTALTATRHQGKGEIHFGWVLEGRAIQDVWMTPRVWDDNSRLRSHPQGLAYLLDRPCDQ